MVPETVWARTSQYWNEVPFLDVARGVDQEGERDQKVHEPGEGDLRLPGDHVDNHPQEEQDCSDDDVRGLEQHGKNDVEADECLDDVSKVHSWRSSGHTMP
jgi:hypothetical protein